MNGMPYEIYRKTQFDKLPPEEWGDKEIFFPVKSGDRGTAKGLQSLPVSILMHQHDLLCKNMCFNYSQLKFSLPAPILKMVFLNSGIDLGHRVIVLCADGYGIPVCFDKKFCLLRPVGASTARIHAI